VNSFCNSYDYLADLTGSAENLLSPCEQLNAFTILTTAEENRGSKVSEETNKTSKEE
jgi:hypothetical protein